MKKEFKMVVEIEDEDYFSFDNLKESVCELIINDDNYTFVDIVEDKETSFKEAIFEIAFGDDAINKDYTEEEVIKKVREFSDKAYEVEEWKIMK